jgi:hypothetical protein
VSDEWQNGPGWEGPPSGEPPNVLPFMRLYHEKFKFIIQEAGDLSLLREDYSMHAQPRYLIEHEDSSQVVIRDLGPWEKHLTVTNGVETVVSELAPTIGKKRLFYFDSYGDCDEIIHEDGKFVRFAPGPSRR